MHIEPTDIGDFYLGSTLERDEFMWLSRAQVPDDIQEQFKDKIHWVGDKTMVRVTKGLYGLPQAGRLAFEKLSRLLKRHDYTACRDTPCLFKQATTGVIFTLVVDDFAIKYVGDANLDHLRRALNQHYEVSEELDGTRFAGITLKWHYSPTHSERTCRTSMPGYINNVHVKFNHPTSQDAKL